MNDIMEELDSNRTLQYVKHLEAVQEKLQKQIKDLHAQAQNAKVSPA